MKTPARILLIDDDPAVLELTGELLGLVGHTVTSVTSADAALEMIANGETFDAVITDQSMPGMTGAELILRLRLLVPEMPCLLITGHGENADVEEGITVLRKPYRAAHLAAALADLAPPPDRLAGMRFPTEPQP